jgi:hypothetical protein
MPDDLKFDGQEQERDATRLLPSAFLSLDECEALARQVVARAQQHSPVHLLAGFTFPNLLLHSTDQHPALIEYLHHLILTHPLVSDPADGTEELVNELFDDVKNIFGAVTFARAFQNGKPTERSELHDSLTMDSLVIRGKSYLVHQYALLERFLGSIDGWLNSHLEIRADDFLRAAKHVFEEINQRANRAIADIQTANEILGKGSFELVLERDIFRLEPPDEGIGKVFRLLSAEPGSLATPTSLLPGRVWPTSRDYPILSYGGVYYCFNPQPVVEELPRLVSDWIARDDKRFFDRRYARTREGVLTEMTLEALARVFPDSVYGSNLYYGPSPSDRSETDGVLLYDDIAIVVEAKAGAVSFSARKGSAERIERDFGNLVATAFLQAKRAADFIRGNPKGIFTDKRGRPVLKLENRRIRKVYHLNPVLESMDAFAVELADARESGLLPPDAEWPWCVFINDLQLVTDILDTPSVFLLYLDRRLRFNAHSHWFRVHDELDLLDYFLHAGLFLEQKPVEEADYVHWQADSEELEQYFAAQAMGLELPKKPHPPFLPEIETLVRRIEASKVVGRTALAMEVLGLGEASHRRMLEVLSILPSRLVHRHHPQSGSFVREKVGLSLWFTEGLTPEVEERLRFETACNKYGHKADQWLSGIFELKNDDPRLVKVFHDSEPWHEDPEMAEVVRTIRDVKFEKRTQSMRPRRNDPCPCGSGKKFKKCHGR